MKLCPVPSCQKRIHNSLLMCSKHWLAAPKPLRLQVTRTLRAVDRFHGFSSNFFPVVEDYRKACLEAIDVVTRSELPVCD